MFQVVFTLILFRHKDVFTIGDRFFRWEFPKTSLFPIKKIVEGGNVKENKPDIEGEKILTPKVKAPVPELPVSKRIAELEADGTPNKRTRVGFGQYISPELFGKDLSLDAVCKFFLRPSY